MTVNEGGTFYEVLLPNGVRVSGLAPSPEAAKDIIRAVETGGAYPCDNCSGAVVWDAGRRIWVHKYRRAPDADTAQCYPPNESPSAFPAAPKDRGRPYRRGLWANGGNNSCGPGE